MRARIAKSVCLILMATMIAAPAADRPTGDQTGDPAGSFPGPATWRAAAASGAPVAVELGGREVRIVVAESDGLFAPDSEALGLDGEPVARRALPLTGTVVGAPGSWVRLTLDGDDVFGTVVVPGAGSFAVGMEHGAPSALSDPDIAGRLRDAGIDTVIEPVGTEEPVGCDSLQWVPQVASPTTLIEEDPLRTFDVAFSVDETYVARHPANWQALATSAINSVDGLFRAAFDIRLSVVHLIAIPDEDVPGTTTTELLDEVQLYYRAHYPNLPRDNAHLFTGKETSNAAGQVNCVGSAGRTTVSYSVSQADPGGNFVIGPLLLLPDGAFKIAAHELAHTLSDHHHYSNCAETVPTFDPFRTMDVCTVMINDWGLIAPVFSTVDRLTVRGWADSYDI